MTVVRRSRVVLAGVLAVAVVAVGPACGRGSRDSGAKAGGPKAGGNRNGGSVKVGVLTKAAATPAAGDDPHVAGQATLPFGGDLFRAVSATAPGGANVVVSPLSVAIALGMLEPGVSGDVRGRLQQLLRIQDPAQFHASMRALQRSLNDRKSIAGNPGENPGEVTVRVADAAYLQHDYPFQQPYLDTIGSYYGPVVNAVDFRPDPDAVAHQINRFVDEHTSGRIRDIVPDGALDPATKLALVNALYLKASWLDVFQKSATKDQPFTRADRSQVTVPMMHATGDSSLRGDGWVAATKAYVGGLAIQFVLPDDGRFDEVVRDLPAVFAAVDAGHGPGAPLGVPRFQTRRQFDLRPPLQSLGLTDLFTEGHLLGIADDPNLVLDKAFHQTFLAVDEEGTEAAAATVLVAVESAGSTLQPVPVILDRPFLFRIFDHDTGATLFLGRILDPTA